MDLRSIKHPDFLKNLSIRQCTELANEIRAFLIDSVSKTGGHLSSNLGVVELTIALHKVFDSPQDKLIFDVGHQSYVHKILTGRADRFSTLRQYEGLSGFNKRSESEHDVWEAGHSSTSLSAALGMAVVRDLNHQNHHIVALIGDGSIINGMAFEALNHIGELGKNVIIVFNDNNMSISKNVGAMSNAFARLRASKSYNTLKQDVKDVLKTNVVGNTVLKGMTAVRDTLKSHIVNSSIFGELGIEYLGPIDGHSIKELIRAFETAKKHQGPIVIHAITQKGKGYPHSESDKDGSWHGV
ncbi:MAG: 1-deoxy-D-xylulose-5-phosphate synthase, partial [Erysipelothrix sp.]|nr:1-deoxy-D-xylulose-5-phosphate synthase [Erysipelothrix sp.]